MSDWPLELSPQHPSLRGVFSGVVVDEGSDFIAQEWLRPDSMVDMLVWNNKGMSCVWSSLLINITSFDLNKI